MTPTPTAALDLSLIQRCPDSQALATYDLDESGKIITGIHFRLADGRTCNAFGTVLRFQNLADWIDYVSALSSRAEIRDAWRLLLINHASHDFDKAQFEAASAVLRKRDARLEMVYTEK